jgi:signal transduction histidine kinase
MVTASRVSPQEAAQLWGGQTHFVYAAMPQPALLASYRLEMLIAAGILLAAALTGWAAWWLVGRTLRPVEAMRSRIAEITVSDLAMRVPQPPGDDELARLARTANQTLARLQDAMENQRRFGLMVSHELRRPLTGLRTQLEETLLYPDASPRRAVRDALATADQMQAVIEEMMTLARISSGPRSVEPVDLAALARGEVIKRPDDPPIHLQTGGPLTVVGNPVQLGSALANLLANAQRHARTSAYITVTRTKNHATITVDDDGDGIASEHRERVFQPFVRLSEGRERDPAGSGLGLAICRAVAQAHNGTLHIEDSPRGGARFCLRLPLISPPGTRS